MGEVLLWLCMSEGEGKKEQEISPIYLSTHVSPLLANIILDSIRVPFFLSFFFCTYALFSSASTNS